MRRKPNRSSKDQAIPALLHRTELRMWSKRCAPRGALYQATVAGLRANPAQHLAVSPGIVANSSTGTATKFGSGAGASDSPSVAGQCGWLSCSLRQAADELVLRPLFPPGTGFAGVTPSERRSRRPGHLVRLRQLRAGAGPGHSRAVVRIRSGDHRSQGTDVVLISGSRQSRRRSWQRGSNPPCATQARLLQEWNPTQ